MSSEQMEKLKRKHEELQNANQQLVAAKQRKSELQDEKERLEKEKQIEEEHLKRIDSEFTTLNLGTIVSYQNQIEDSKNKITKYNQRKDRGLSDMFWVAPMVVGCCSFRLGVPIILYKIFLNSFLINIMIFGGLAISIGSAAIGKFGIIDRIAEKHLNRKIKKEKQKLLSISKQVKENFTNNPELVDKKSKLEQEKEETQNKIRTLSNQIAGLVEKIKSNNADINYIQPQIDELFYRLSVFEVELLLQGETIESTKEEQPVKRLGEMKGGNKNDRK